MLFPLMMIIVVLTSKPGDYNHMATFVFFAAFFLTIYSLIAAFRIFKTNKQLSFIVSAVATVSLALSTLGVLSIFEFMLIFVVCTIYAAYTLFKNQSRNR